MNKFMDWMECEEKYIRKVQIDKNKIKSIIKAAEKRQIIIDKIGIDKETVSFVVENYYEIIKELLVALLLSNGIKSSNHQCLISYFYKNYPELESYAHLISEMSFLRNRLNYYGELIDYSFYDKNKDKIIKIILKFKENIKKLLI
jgi:uncharacterized protein (UPF0332 family)